MRCTRQRMQLVGIIAVLVLARMGHGCHFGCHPINFSIPVKSCGLTVNVDTTICAGQCFHANPAYIGIADRDEHKVCNGDWTYEVKHIEGCPESISYAVARNCRCAACDPDKMYCGRFLEDIPSCLPF